MKAIAMIQQLGQSDITHCIFCSNPLYMREYDYDVKICPVCPQEISFEKDDTMYNAIIVDNLNGWAVEFSREYNELIINNSPGHELDYDFYQMSQQLFEQLVMGLYYLPDLIHTLTPTNDDNYDDFGEGEEDW